MVEKEKKLEQWADSAEGRLLEDIYIRDRRTGTIIRRNDYIHTIGNIDLFVSQIVIKSVNNVVTRYTLVSGSVVEAREWNV